MQIPGKKNTQHHSVRLPLERRAFHLDNRTYLPQNAPHRAATCHFRRDKIPSLCGSLKRIITAPDGLQPPPPLSATIADKYN